MKKQILALLTVSLLGAGSAQANLLSFSASYGPDLTDWDPAKTLSLPQFAPSLGILNSVQLTLSGQMRAEFFASNPSVAPQSVTDQLLGTMTFNAPTFGNRMLNFSSIESFQLAGWADDDRFLESQSSVTLAAGAAAFLGGGSFNIGIQASGQSAISGSGNLDGGAVTHATSTATIAYDYTPSKVPEPASLSLLGLALGCASLAARRRH